MGLPSCCGDNDVVVDGETKPRKCTDILWLIIFIIFWIVMIFIAGFAVVYGNPLRLVNGYDSFGNVCGMKNYAQVGEYSGMDMSDKPHLFYFDITDLSHSMKICISKCPDQTLNTSDEFLQYQTERGVRLCRDGEDYGGLMKSVPKGKATHKGFDILHNALGPCPVLPVYQSSSILNRCVPKPNKEIDGIFYNIYATLNQMDLVQQVLSDLYDSRWQIVGFAFLAVVASFIMVMLVHFLTSIVTWIFMVIVSLAAIAGTIFMWLTYVEIKYNLDITPVNQLLQTSVSNERAFLTYAIIATIFTVLLLILILVMRKRVSLVVKLFKEAANCVASMPWLLLQPVITYVALMLFFIFWMVVMACLATANHPGIKPTTKSVSVPYSTEPPDVISTMEYSESEQNFTTYHMRGLTLLEYVDPSWVQYFWWYYIIAMIWISEFILACQQMVIAGSVAQWYFTRNKQGITCVVCHSVTNMIFYHLGSIAKGSFLITLFKLPRLMLTYMDAQLQKYEDNSCIKCLRRCCICCLYCLEKFIRYLNHNAYTVIAIQGCDFCPAAQISFKTIVENALRVATINSVGDFMLFLGKCSVTIVVGLCSLFVYKHNNSLHMYAIPFLVTCVFTYFIAHCVFSIYEMAIDTLFLCFMEDDNKNSQADQVDGKVVEYYSPPSLREYMTVDAVEGLRKTSGKSRTNKVAVVETEMIPMSRNDD